jgi:uncharacterized membrane protein
MITSNGIMINLITIVEFMESNFRRHILKTISYRVMATSITIGTALILGLDIQASALLGVGEIMVKPIFYFFHERVWYKLIRLKNDN